MSDDFKPPAPPSEQAPRTNRLATVAFLAALLGFCIPVVPSLIALALGIVGLRREPRGIAIGAVALAVLQCIALAAIVIGLTALSRSAPARQSRAMKEARSVLDDAIAAERRDGEDRFPIGRAARVAATDPWGSPYRVEVVRVGTERTVRLWSAGPDRRLDTEDDFVAAIETDDRGAVTRDEPRARRRGSTAD
jgi:hypothetical protein